MSNAEAVSGDETKPSIDELQAENERQAAEPTKLKAKRKHPGRARNVTVIAILIIATLLFPIALTAHWGNRTLNDPDQYAASVAPLAQDQSIQKAVGTVLTGAIVKQLDLQAKIPEFLPPKLEPLSGAIAGAVNAFIGTAVDKLLASEQFQQLWVALNKKLAEGLVRALQGDEDGAVSLQGKEVVLDTGDLILVVKQQLLDKGLSIADKITVPPAADRQIVLLDAPALAEVRTIYKFTSPIAQYGIYFVFLLYLLAIFISTRRMRGLMLTGISLLIGAILLRIGLSIGQSSIGVALAATPFAGLEAAFWGSLTQYLRTALEATFAMGLIFALVGWLGGGSSAAQSARRLMSQATAASGNRTTNARLAAAGRWTLRFRNVLRAAIVVVAALVFIGLNRVTAGAIIGTAAVAVIAWILIEYFAAVGRANGEPSDSPPDSTDAPEPELTVDSS